MAFVCEPTGNLLAKGALRKDGAGFVLEDHWNLLASSDEWVSPVHAEVGPDGAVWVADWYNFIIQHNPTPTEKRGGYQAETGKGNAHVNPLRDRSYGRIYRIVHKNTEPVKMPNLSNNSPEECINALRNTNLFWRLHGQRLLVERGQEDVIKDLIRLVQNTDVDELGLNGAAIHALWTMHGLGAFDNGNHDAIEAAKQALGHPAAGVRKAAVQVLPKENWLASEILEADIINDPDPHTQLAALLSISELPETLEIGKALYELGKSIDVVEDLWLSQALFIAAGAHHNGFLEAYNSDQTATVYQLTSEEKKNQHPSVWEKWEDPRKVTGDWKVFKAGIAWEETVLPEFNGRVIAYKEINLETVPNEAFLHLGKIGQSDRAFVNGTMLHETRNDPEKLRIYEVPVNTLHTGMNYLTLTIADDNGPGGLLGPESDLYFQADESQISITGDWKYLIQEKKSRGINYSEFNTHDQLGARFIAYNSGWRNAQNQPGLTISDPDAVRIRLRAVRNEMTYDQNELLVPAGKPIEIVFENGDLMQHNLLVIAPGSLETVGNEYCMHRPWLIQVLHL